MVIADVHAQGMTKSLQQYGLGLTHCTKGDTRASAALETISGAAWKSPAALTIRRPTGGEKEKKGWSCSSFPIQT